MNHRVAALALALATQAPLFAPLHAQTALPSTRAPAPSNAPAPSSVPAPSNAPAQPNAPAAAQAPAAPVAARADASRFNAAIVRIESRAVQGAASAESLGGVRAGSGVIIGERLVLTIGYLLLETESIEVTTSSGKRVPSTVAGYDHATGFGLVRTVLPLDGTPLELGDSDKVHERQKVLTLGQGERETTELVVVSRKLFTGSWEYLLERPIYTFPPVTNWSGSALLTEDGKLVGIGSLIVSDAASDRSGVPGNLFVPVNLVKPILSDLISDGRRRPPVQPWLGISTEQVRGNLVVARVARDGPAESAGIGSGDIVLAVDGERVVDQASFYRRVWTLGPAGTEVTVRVLKDGAVRDIRLRSIDRMDVLRKPVGV